jgi:hypothetical protein
MRTNRLESIFGARGVNNMIPHRAALLIIAILALASQSAANADEKQSATKRPDSSPGAGQAGKPVPEGKELQDEEKRIREQLLAESLKDDRLYKQMVKADPNDVRAWKLLGWNDAYNLCAATDDAAERYRYITQGVTHLMEGLTHNPKNAALTWDIGSYLFSKIEQSNVRKQFRAMFREDKNFHALLARRVDLKAVAGPDGLPDNNLVAQRWFEETINLVEKHGSPPELPNSVRGGVLYMYPALCQTGYARAIEGDGHFDESAVRAWKQAQKMWDVLGDREFSAEDGTKYRLKDNEAARKQINYDYWKRRSVVEQTQPLLDARRALYRAREHLSGFKRANEAVQRPEFTDEARGRAKQLFDEAFRLWAGVFKAHPWLVESDDDITGVIGQYQRRVLNGEPLPDDFPLRQFPELLPGKP